MEDPPLDLSAVAGKIRLPIDVAEAMRVGRLRLLTSVLGPPRYRRPPPGHSQPRGTLIAGTWLVRDYCVVCGAPMRATPNSIDQWGGNTCTDCDDPPPAHFRLVARQKAGCQKTDS